jgi:hypothetical protein
VVEDAVVEDNVVRRCCRGTMMAVEEDTVGCARRNYGRGCSGSGKFCGRKLWSRKPRGRISSRFKCLDFQPKSGKKAEFRRYIAAVAQKLPSKVTKNAVIDTSAVNEHCSSI